MVRPRGQMRQRSNDFCKLSWHALNDRRRGRACRPLGVDTFAGRGTASGVPRSHRRKLTTGRLATRTIERVVYWLVNFLWVGAVPVLVFLGHLMLAPEA
jgi:hypothetical protein